MWDVAIIGAGPAGSTAAYHLAKRGYKTILLDKKSFPRDKVCGDGLIPDTLRCLERMGLLEKVLNEGREINKILAFSPSGLRCEVGGRFVTMKRYRFDSLLLTHATNAGAEFRPSDVKEITATSGLVKFKTLEGEIIEARTGILATGADMGLARKLGIVSQPKANAVALRCYIKSALSLEHLVFSFDRQILPGYAWIFPLPDGEFNVGCGIFAGKKFLGSQNIKKIFNLFLTQIPMAAELLAKGEIISEIRGHTLRCGLTGTSPFRIGNLLTAGETIGTTFPFSGEGIGKAMESGEKAAEVASMHLESGDPEVLNLYEYIIASELRPKYKGYQMAERWITNPRIADFLVRRMQKSSFLRNSVRGIIEETIDPKVIFSPMGLMRSLLF